MLEPYFQVNMYAFVIIQNAYVFALNRFTTTFKGEKPLSSKAFITHYSESTTSSSTLPSCG
jgi:hypothetical protein